MWRIIAAELLIVLAGAAAMVWLHDHAITVRSYADVRAAYQSSEARLLDRHGQVIQELRVDETRRRLAWTSLAEVSPAFTDAVVRAEDHRFRSHAGVDLPGIAAAVWHNATGNGTSRGASTITMQLAAALDPALRPVSGARTWTQKWQQMRAARAIERSWSKDEILEAYVNLITFRGELQGIAAASRGLFGKEPSGLTHLESLILAALIRNPNATPASVARRACALSTAAQRDPTSAGPTQLSGSSSAQAPPIEREGERNATCRRIKALAQAAVGAVARLRPGIALAPHVARQLLRKADRDVPSTLDADLQRYASEALRHQLQHLQAENVRDGALLAVDNTTGEVLAYVGNTGNNPKASYVDGVTALRQAGSTLKPFLYGLALEQRRLTAASLLNDAPVNLLTPTGAYVPQNYDKEFRGWVSVRTALAGSLNVPAVRTLMLVGVENFADRLRRLGFSGVAESGDYYGYSLALGSAEVTLWQLVNAYRIFANSSRIGPLTLQPRPAPDFTDALDPAAAFIVSDVLSDRGARSVTFGLDNPIALPFWAAVKTGTSKDMRDNWCIGYSTRYTVGVWVGNFDGESMHDVSGVTGAAPVWAEVMQYLHRGAAYNAPSPPANVVTSSVQFEPPLEAGRAEYFLRGTETERIALNVGARRKPRILYPGRGMIIALDPDIPGDRQRVFFSMEPANASLFWQLDGRTFGGTTYGWQPQRGEHTLRLVDASGEMLDQVRFIVRGRSL